MSIQTQFSRILLARNKLRTKLVELGLVRSTAKLDDCANAVDEIENQGAVSTTVQEGDTYTIPRGYHNGSGTVSGIKGGGNYTLQSKTITPVKSQLNITPDDGFYGLSDVTVKAIPESYQDVSSVTATASDVLANKMIVDSSGMAVAGTMPDNGAVGKTLDTGTTSYTVPKGYHSGAGAVGIITEEKSVTPSRSVQDITPSTGKVLAKVAVGAIPENYVDTSGANAAAGNILAGKTAYVKGSEITGAMPDNGSVSADMDGLTVTSINIPAGYTSGGTIKLTNDIEMALAEI